MSDDELLQNATCALQDAYHYLEELSFYDSDIAQCKDKIQECYGAIESRIIEDE